MRKELQLSKLSFLNICHKISVQPFEDHSHIVWIGDMNYRIELPNDFTRASVEEGNLEVLVQNDQLKEQIKCDRAFSGFQDRFETILQTEEWPMTRFLSASNKIFSKQHSSVLMSNILNCWQEAEITFPPTYKYDAGTSQFDSSPKSRIPAYTDRILWKTKDIGIVRSVFYRSHPEITCSDHKPVSALLLARVEKVDQVAYKKVYKEVTTWLDRHENELIPQISVSSKKIIFPDIRFNRTLVQNVQLRNTGKSPVQFQIIDSKLFSPDRVKYPSFSSEIGLSISPNMGLLPPGENSLLSISFSLHIDKDCATRNGFAFEYSNK